MRKYQWIVLVLVCLAGYAAFAEDVETEEQKLIGDISSGSNAGEVHVLKLYDNEGVIVHPQADPIPPISLRRTCGVCHDYGAIVDGWHFNQRDLVIVVEDGVDKIIQGDPGRKGEPWIYWDARTAVQIPLSYRQWEGTFSPETIGLSDWEFTKIFGKNMPGGGVGVKDENTVEGVGDKWELSGNYRVNCLSCHDAEAGHNQSECALQVGKGNFQWAVTGSSAFATVQGNAGKLPPLWMPGEDHPDLPKVTLDASRFGAGRRIFVDIEKKVPNKRCYFCHSNKHLGGSMDEDVHIAAGLMCVDCHSNGLDHMMVRGYEGEKESAAATCKGCHLGVEGSQVPTAGRLGAPVPEHKNIPEVHFDKLSCTACHSGPWPGETTSYVKTSRAHALGTRSVNAADDTLPHIQWPVFIRGSDGKITPSKLMWPAYWGVLKGDAVTPLAPKVVTEMTGGILPFAEELQDNGNWEKAIGRGESEAVVKSLTEEIVVKALGALAGKGFDGEPIYIAGGKLYQLESGKLIAGEHDSAKPYTWAIAHNVRPAAQSLGIRGCEDCHAKDSPLLFGKVKIDTPIGEEIETMAMQQFHHAEVDIKNKAVSSFFKWLIIIVMSLLILHILGDLFRRIMKKFSSKEN